MHEETFVKRYKLVGESVLYFAPAYNKMWIDETNSGLEKIFYSTELTDLRIEITYNCNGRCKYCIVYGNEIEKFDSINMKVLLDNLKEKKWFSKIKTILLIGGEPLLFFDQIEYLLENYDGEVRISTNGTLITGKVAKKLSKKNVMIYISLDGPNEQDNIMRVYNNGSAMYNDIIKGLSYLLEENVRFGIFTVATKENVYNSVEVLERMDEMYHPYSIGYSLPHWTKNNDYEITAVEYRKALIDLYNNRKKIDAEIMQIKWRLKPLWDGKIKKYSCSMHTSQKTILSDTSIVRCSKIDHDLIYSQLSNDFFEKNCPVALSLNKINPCAKCIAVASCGGGCPYDGLKRFGGAIDKRECMITPNLIELALNDVVRALNKDVGKIEKGMLSGKFIRNVLN